MEFVHRSVLLWECIDALNIKPDGIYLDGTLGGAGHSSQIVQRLQTASGRNAAIDACQVKIAELMPRMKEGRRMLPYFLMSDGQKLLNRYAVWLHGGEEDAAKLAAQLECWYHEYKSLWRKTSRESELYRLGEVIFWLADTLRKDK